MIKTPRLLGTNARLELQAVAIALLVSLAIGSVLILLAGKAPRGVRGGDARNALGMTGADAA